MDHFKKNKDSSLRQFGVAGAFGRNEGGRLCRSFQYFSLIHIRSDGPSPTGSRPEDSRSRRGDGEHVLVRGFCGRTEEPPCSSRYRRTNSEANNRMWFFHSRVYTTQL